MIGRARIGAGRRPTLGLYLFVPFLLAAALAAQAPPAAGARPACVAIGPGPMTMGADPARDAQAFDNERGSVAQGEGTLDLVARGHAERVARHGPRGRATSARGHTAMAGNVWEWTRSLYQPYPYDEADDRSGLDADALRVMRGGAFNDPARRVRASARGAAEPGARRADIGFCAASAWR